MKKVRLAVMAVFILFLAGMSLAGLAVKDREFSPNENRYLELAPKFGWSSVMEGKFQEKLESYLNDQIVGRDRWITLKTAVQKLIGNTDIGGAYVGRDGYDFEKITPEDVDEKQVKRNITAVKDFFDMAAEEIAPERLSFLLVPTSGLVMEDKLPKNARLFDQGKYIDEVRQAMDGYNFVDVRQELISHRDEYIYYRTDHHWTTDGAYLVYERWCDSIGMRCAGIENQEKNIVAEDFRGSLYSKILDADSAYDSIWIYGSTDGTWEVTVDEKEAGSLYDTSKLNEKDKYAFFLGGNYGQVKLTCNPAAEDREGRSLLVVKDSFANAFVPFPVMEDNEFCNIYMVDLRYYNGDMKEYLSTHGITDVLVLYNVSNFISDQNLYKLAGGR